MIRPNTFRVVCLVTLLGIGWLHPASVLAEAELKAGMVDPKTGKKIKYWVAPMDPTYIRNEPGQSPMGMDLEPVYEEAGEEKEPTSTIRIDPVTVQNMGVRLGRVQRKVLSKRIRTFGSITYNERQVYTVNTKFDGWIEKLHVDFLGDRVTKGQPLFEIYSPELFAAQQEYLLAFQQYQRNRNHSNGTLLEAARTRLRYWDLQEYQIRQIETSGEIRKTLTIYSPANGVVTKKNAFQGHYVKAGIHQYEIADLSTVWVDVDVYEFELPWVGEGMRAEMELAYIPGRRFEGEVLYVYPYLDPKTRTAKLRLSFDNADGSLKPGMWANVYLESALPGRHIVIPQEAVIDSGVRKVVFVALGKGRFMPREVTLGVEGKGYRVQVLEGLAESEEIVLSGQFLPHQRPPRPGPTSLHPGLVSALRAGQRAGGVRGRLAGGLRQTIPGDRRSQQTARLQPAAYEGATGHRPQQPRRGRQAGGDGGNRIHGARAGIHSGHRRSLRHPLGGQRRRWSHPDAQRGHHSDRSGAAQGHCRLQR
jgi:Cu(I)/Ag(I) efflux system membrane fusion protein/cobalt-zinc-cadmium efflux system membrane fusion protein